MMLGLCDPVNTVCLMGIGWRNKPLSMKALRRLKLRWLQIGLKVEISRLHRAWLEFASCLMEQVESASDRGNLNENINPIARDQILSVLKSSL